MSTAFEVGHPCQVVTISVEAVKICDAGFVLMEKKFFPIIDYRFILLISL